MSEEKAKYRVLRLSFIGNQLLEEGAEVEYDGEPGTNLHPLNDAAVTAHNAKFGKSTSEAEKPEVHDGLKEEGGDLGDGDIEALRDEYEALFNKKPHPAMKADTLREKITEVRQRLGN